MKYLKLVQIAGLFFFSIFILPCAAQEIEFKVGGKIETAHGIRWKKELEYSLSRSIAQIKSEIFAGSSYAALSCSAEYNYRNAEKTGFTLNEAYYRYSGEIWDITFGRQIIAWGQADGFTLTDVLSAKDLSGRIALNAEDRRLASDSVRLRFFHDIFTFEAIAVPFFTQDILPPFSFENKSADYLFSVVLPTSAPFFGNKKIALKYELEKAAKPKAFTGTEAAVKFAFFLPAMDFSFSGFYGWNKTPEFCTSGKWSGSLSDSSKPFHPEKNNFIPKLNLDNVFSIPIITIKPEYYRIGMAGFDAAIPAGPLLIRLETAWVYGRKFAPKTDSPIKGILFTKDSMLISFHRQLRKHQILMLAGIDWTYNTWFLSGQYFEDLVICGKNELDRSIHKGFVSLNLSKTFLRETLKLSVSGVIGVNYGSTFSTYSVDYALTDNLHMTLGTDIYTKGYKGKGDFAALKDVSTLWLRGKFSW